MKGLKKLKIDANSVLLDMVVDSMNNSGEVWDGNKYAKKIHKIIDKASKLKDCSCLPCGCNELGKIYCQDHYQKFYI